MSVKNACELQAGDFVTRFVTREDKSGPLRRAAHCFFRKEKECHGCIGG